MKKVYTTPKFEMIKYDVQDVVSVSDYTPIDAMDIDNANSDENWAPGFY